MQTFKRRHIIYVELDLLQYIQVYRYKWTYVKLKFYTCELFHQHILHYHLHDGIDGIELLKRCHFCHSALWVDNLHFNIIHVEANNYSWIIVYLATFNNNTFQLNPSTRPWIANPKSFNLSYPSICQLWLWLSLQ